MATTSAAIKAKRNRRRGDPSPAGDIELPKIMVAINDASPRRQTMICEHVTLEPGDTELSRRFGLTAEARLKALPKSQAKECGNSVDAKTVHLRMIDLNLFRVFDAIMLHRSVRKASQVLSVTPSAVSHALSRLRQSTGDELFIPGDSGMQPTQCALDLASAVREGLEKLALALTGKKSVPREAPRTFRIGATDYVCMVILPSLVKRLAKSASRVDLQVFSSNRIDVVRQLETGRADLVIGVFNKLPAGISRSRLLREDEVIAVRTGHPLTCGRVTKERLVEFPHVVVEPTGTRQDETDGFADSDGVGRRAWIERALQEFQAGKIEPVGRVTVCVPNFAAMVPFLQLSDMVATLPRRLALWAAAHAPLQLLDPPYPSVAVDIEVLRDEGSCDDQGLQWLVNELAESIRDVG
jgi:DNA-binding transcriptional LysR family regulator